MATNEPTKMSKAQLARELVALGARKSVNTLRKLPLETLQGMVSQKRRLNSILDAPPELSEEEQSESETPTELTPLPVYERIVEYVPPAPAPEPWWKRWVDMAMRPVRLAFTVFA